MIYSVVRHSTDVIALCGTETVSGATARDNLVLVPMAEPQLRQRSLQVQVLAGRPQAAGTGALLPDLP